MSNLQAHHPLRQASDPHTFETLIYSMVSKEEIITYVKDRVKIPLTDYEIENGLNQFFQKGLPSPVIAILLKNQEHYCIRCGGCCHFCFPIDFQKEELKKISNYLKISYKKLKKKYHMIPKGKDNCLKTTTSPCPFLTEPNHCQIYDMRPITCRLFPLGLASATALNSGKYGVPDKCPAIKEIFKHLALSNVVGALAVKKFNIDVASPEVQQQVRNMFLKFGVDPDDPIRSVIKEKIRGG